MSKSKGNFYTIDDVSQKFGADATRIALAAAGDTLDDANFTLENVDSSILQLSTLEMWAKEAVKSFSSYREKSLDETIEFFDNTFLNEIKNLTLQTIESFESMRYRDVLKWGFFEFQAIKDDYKVQVGNAGLRKDLVAKYLEYQLLLLYPIAPHFCEIMYRDLVYDILPKDSNAPKFLSLHRLPKVFFLVKIFIFFTIFFG